MPFDFPASPAIGETVEGIYGEVYTWNGVKWTLTAGGGGAGGARVAISATAPSSPTVGMMWWATDVAKLYLWTGAEWVIVINTPGGGAGAYLSAGTNHLRIGGTLIQWGFRPASGGDSWVYFPIEFSDTPTAVLVTPQSDIVNIAPGNQFLAYMAEQAQYNAFLLRPRYGVMTGGGGPASQGFWWLAMGPVNPTSVDWSGGGVTDGSDARPGEVGEYLTTGLVSATTTGAVQTHASLELSPGDWDVSAYFIHNGAAAYFNGCLSFTPGVGLTDGIPNTTFSRDNVIGSHSLSTTGPIRVSTSAPRTVYLCFMSAASGLSATGEIRARRMR